jgi:hypothetical protein
MTYRKSLSLILTLLLLAIILAACSPQATEAPTQTATLSEQAQSSATPTPTQEPTSETESTETTEENPQQKPTMAIYTPLDPEDWQNWPVIPGLSPQMIDLYKHGLELGRDPHSFSVIGDCQSSPTYFLSIYDEGRYTLPEGQAYLQETIDWYAGSFSHLSITVKNGMTAPGVLNPLWRDIQLCESKETPIICEVRVNNPSLAIISLGTNWLPSTSHEQYVDYLAEIVRLLLSQGVIPVLSTKADNIEGDYSRNLAMAEVAAEYSLPLWNFWAAVEHLPNRGLDNTREDVYLVHDGWDVRNLSALELLDHLHKQLLESEE